MPDATFGKRARSAVGSARKEGSKSIRAAELSTRLPGASATPTLPRQNATVWLGRSVLVFARRAPLGRQPQAHLGSAPTMPHGSGGSAPGTEFGRWTACHLARSLQDDAERLPSFTWPRPRLGSRTCRLSVCPAQIDELSSWPLAARARASSVGEMRRFDGPP
jgi:hypothetical protein